MESNFFAVKDADGFRRFCERWDLAPVTNEEGLCGFREKRELWDRMDSWEFGEGDDLSVEVEEADSDASFVDELAGQLADDYVAVVNDTGDEHYPRGPGLEVFAINNRREIIGISLNTIFNLARKLGRHVVREMAF